MKTNRIAILFITCIFPGFLISQDSINLLNPSFEDFPKKGVVGRVAVYRWDDCATIFLNESPPDIHPVPGNAWEVSKKPQHGKTYLGLVVRYNDTYEIISQGLEIPLEKGECYSVSVYLARSELYKSATTRSDSIENFIRPAVFQIWGGNGKCELNEMLAESLPVENSDWQLNEFVLTPNDDYKYISILAYYETPIDEAYNGHILVDNISPIINLECD